MVDPAHVWVGIVMFKGEEILRVYPTMQYVRSAEFP